MNTPARGPQPILRTDGTTTTSSGTIHTLLILAADRWHTARTLNPQGDHMSKYRDSLDDKAKADLDKLTAPRESGYRGWVGENAEPATKDNTDPRVWEAIQTPFRTADEYR